MVTRTLQIPKDRWTTFLQGLEPPLAGRPVRLEVIDMSLGDQEVATHTPLRGLAYEAKGSDAGNLLILLGSDDDAFHHVVPEPSAIYVRLGEAGQVEWIAIEGRSGKALIHLEELPELERRP